MGALTGNFPFCIGRAEIPRCQKVELAVVPRTKELRNGGIWTYGPAGEEVRPGAILTNQGPVISDDLPHPKI